MFYLTDLDMIKYEWITNPFVLEFQEKFCLTTAKQEIMMDLRGYIETDI